MFYRFQTATPNAINMKLKVEINTTEHFHVQKPKTMSFSMDSEWFSGTTQILTYELEELIATKLRALYQRRKGRDLFDLWLVLKQNLIDVNSVILIFKKYCTHNNQIITSTLFEQNLILKRNHRDFAIDIKPLLTQESNWNPDEAFELINEKIITRLKD